VDAAVIPATFRTGAAIPQTGTALHITRAASVQFVEPILFRVIRALPWETYYGWIWLDGYVLNSVGTAVARRKIFVQLAGLRIAVDPAVRRGAGGNRR
jgi:hypothetical protein